jgi:hypothetical protein
MRNLTPIILLIATILSSAELKLRDPRRDSDPHTKTHFKPRTFSSVHEWMQHRDELRRRILVSAGLWPMPRRDPIKAQSHGELRRDGYIVEKLLIETLPGFYVGANIYRPTTPTRKAPGVLIAHGHWKNGRIEHNEHYSVPALGAALAANGYVALAYDMVGYNDTRQIQHKFGDSDQDRLWSFGPLPLQLWNSLRVLDYLAARPEVDRARLAVTGASGGGTQTYLLAAVDDRIKISIPTDMVSARFQGDDPCEMSPGLRINTNNMEIAAAVAPRPMLLLSSAKDWTSDTPTIEFPAIREIYNLFGHADQVESFQVDTEHGYNLAQRRTAIQFLDKHFGMPAKLTEPEAFKEPPSEFLVGAAAPQEADRDAVFRSWQTLLTARNARTSAARKSELLRSLTGGHWPTKAIFVVTAGDSFLHRDGESDVVPARLLQGKPAETVIALHKDGTEAAQKMPAIKQAAERQSRILLLDVFATGAAAPNRGRHGDHLVFHYADGAIQVQDILTAAAWSVEHGASRIRLSCGEGTEEVCRLAAAVSPFRLRVDPPATKPKPLQIPGLAAAGFN